MAGGSSILPPGHVKQGAAGDSPPPPMEMALSDDEDEEDEEDVEGAPQKTYKIPTEQGEAVTTMRGTDKSVNMPSSNASF